MKRQQIIVVLIVIVAIAVVGGGILAYFMATQATPSSSENSSISDVSNRSETYKKYAALKGEAYDKEFVANMIVHHESAMNMAEMALASASHQEVKNLATAINTSQGQEVGTMRHWQTQWGYPATSGHMMTDSEHAGDSMEGMSDMNSALVGLSGDAFDKKFLELMIEHHQGAIDMSEPADANAQHQEVKDLARAIITAQTKEITQMRAWLDEWGYKG